MSTYFFVIFEVHYLVFRYNVFLEEYMNLSLRLRSGHEKGKKEWESKKELNNNLTDSSIQQNIKLATTLLLQRIHIFTILEAPYV